MKPTKIISTLSILFLATLSLNAQDCTCPEETVEEPTTVLTTIGEQDYPNFLTLNGLKRYSNIRYSGLLPGSADAKSFTIRTNGKRYQLNATYGADGNLIRGIYTTKDSNIPRTIRDYLATDDFKGWTMIHNKTIVRDFDVERTEYEVNLERDGVKQTLLFDHSGNRIRRLARS